jgi:hypothetical protein
MMSAKLVKELYAAAGMSCFLSSPKSVSNCNSVSPSKRHHRASPPGAAAPKYRRYTLSSYFPHDLLIEGLLMSSKDDGPRSTSGAS